MFIQQDNSDTCMYKKRQMAELQKHQLDHCT